MIKLERCEDKDLWNGYIVENDGHPLQLWEWGSLKSAHGWAAERLLFYSEWGEIVGAVQLLIRKLPKPFNAFCYVPRGVIAGEGVLSELLQVLADYCRSEYRAVLLKVEPDCENFAADGFIRTKNHILPSKTIILDLTKTDAELMADMAKKTRQYIRKSAGEVAEIRAISDRGELTKCLNIYHQTAARAGFNLHDDDYYYDAFDQLGEFSQLFAAFVDNEPVAFLWLVISGDVAFELYGGMNEVGQNLRANYALKWYAILKCKDWGLSRYDFGGIIDGGVGDFKRNWTLAETDLAGSFDYPLSTFYGLWDRGLPTAKKVIRKFKANKR